MEEKPANVLFAPLVTKERFSELSGLGAEVVRGMIEKGHLPSVKVGKYRLVNLSLVHEEALREVWEK